MRAVALNPKPDNLLDHLGVLAAILEIPLIVSEERTYKLARSLYPKVDTILMEENAITLDFLAKNYDILFVSSKLWAIEFHHLLPLFSPKKIRVVYCPHGNSDKGHTTTPKDHAPEDISLVYGDHMLDLLRDTGQLEKISLTIPTGNYRYSFFRQEEAFYRPLAEKALFSKLDRFKKTIFYAPTWNGSENPSSFFTECVSLIEQISPSFNLLIKLHPYLYERDPVQTLLITERYQEHPQVLFLEDFPPIYPILSLVDAYLGDFSSIGYDFLAFDKPMYFFNPGKQNDRGLFLHKCGIEVSTDENVFKAIEKSFSENQRTLSQVRKNVYDYTFGRERSFAELSESILNVAECDRKNMGRI